MNPNQIRLYQQPSSESNLEKKSPPENSRARHSIVTAQFDNGGVSQTYTMGANTGKDSCSETPKDQDGVNNDRVENSYNSLAMEKFQTGNPFIISERASEKGLNNQGVCLHKDPQVLSQKNGSKESARMKQDLPTIVLQGQKDNNGNSLNRTEIWSPKISNQQIQKQKQSENFTSKMKESQKKLENIEIVKPPQTNK